MKTIAAITKLRGALADPVEPENMRIIAVAYWRFLVILSLAAIVCVLYIGYARFNGVSQLFSTNAPEAPIKSTFSRTSLDSAVAVFDARALRYASLKAVPLIDSDPSK